MDVAHRYALGMPKRKIISHAARLLRETVAVNFGRAVARSYPEIAKSAAYFHIRRATGASLSTLQRIEKAQVGAQMDTLADIAYHLGTTVPALVSPPGPLSGPSGKLRAAT